MQEVRPGGRPHQRKAPGIPRRADVVWEVHGKAPYEARRTGAALGEIVQRRLDKQEEQELQRELLEIRGRVQEEGLGRAPTTLLRSLDLSPVSLAPRFGI